MKLTQPHLSKHGNARPRRLRTSVLGLVAVSMAATSAVVVLGQVDSASAISQPSAQTTGVPAGTHLTVYNGNLTITKAGSVWDKLDVHGFVYIKAPNVTLKRSIVRGGISTSDVGLVNVTDASAKNFHIHDVELVPDHPSVQIDGIKGWNYKATRLNIHGTVDGAKVWGNDVFIQFSYIHDLVQYPHDPDQNNGPTHNDGVQVLGGRHIRILYNNFVLQSYVHTALEVSQDVAAVSDLQFMNNWADGAVCTVNMTQKPLASMSDITVNNNIFGSDTPPSCTIVAKPAVTFTAVGNIMEATDTPARVRVLS